MALIKPTPGQITETLILIQRIFSIERRIDVERRVDFDTRNYEERNSRKDIFPYIHNGHKGINSCLRRARNLVF